MMEKGLTLIQRVAICFAAGVIGGLAVVLFSRVLFGFGVSASTRSKCPDLLQIAGYIQAAVLGRALGYPVRALYQDRLEPALPVRSSIFPRTGAGAVFNLPADGRCRIFRASAGRANVHSLPGAGKSALRDNHRFGRQGDNRKGTVNILDEIKKPPDVVLRLEKPEASLRRKYKALVR